MRKCLLGVDIGGGSIRCAVYNPEKAAFTIIKRELGSKAIYKVGDFGYSMDPMVIYKKVGEVIQAALIEAECSSSDIAALSLSTMRHSLVAVDNKGKVLYASSNRDARAVDPTMRLNDSMAESIYAVSGHKPMPNLMACKLIWLKETQPDLYNNIAYAYSINDYLLHRMTGKIIADRTHAAETMLYDLLQNKWSDKLIKEMGLKSDYLPEIINCGDKVGKLTPDCAKEFGLDTEVDVICGAGDTQSALLALNAVEKGSIGMVLGTTAPIQMNIDKPIIDPKGRLWTGVSAIAGQYVLESNGGGMGVALEWIAGLLFSDNPKPIAAAMAAATKAKAGAGGALSTIGAAVFNNSVLALPIDQLLFSTTNYTPSNDDKNKISRAAIEGMAFAIRANIEQIEEVAGIPSSRISVGGGISKDMIILDIISDTLVKSIFKPQYVEASAVGSIIAAAYGIGMYKSLKEASNSIVKLTEIFSDNNSYERIYEEWKEMYQTSLETNMSLGALINELRAQEFTEGVKETALTADLRIYVDADLSEDAVNMLKEFGSVTHKSYRDGDMLEGDDMIATLKDYDVFITEVDIVDANIIKALPNLRMIGVCRGNPTNIDIDACSAAGIPVVYTPGRNSDAVADLTVAHILSIIRMMPQSAAFLKEEGGEAGDMGRMGAAYFRYQGMELWRKTVGIIGGGAIGKKVARRLLGFDANLLVFDPYLSYEDAVLMGAKKVELDYLLKNSDIITLHAPVTESTKNMIDKQAFDKMKDGVYFINTARAALVDYDALTEALKRGKVRGAGLDVFTVEPPAYNDPLVQMENVLCTPHIAGNTIQVGIHQGMIMAENIKLLMQGIMSSDVINRKSIGTFSFTGEKTVDSSALDKLSGKSVGVNDLDTGKEKPKAAEKKEPVAKVSAATASNLTGYSGYMALIKEFLRCLANDEEVKEKTKSKDISFQITFKDNEESCYMYFKGGEVEADLGVFPHGTAEVNLRMPIEIFDGMMRGQVNGAKAAMTGKMSFTGNVRKAMSMQSILKLMMGAYETAIKNKGDIDVKNLSSTSTVSNTTSGANYATYMKLIKEFLSFLSNDEEVKEKTKSKDISFQITFKDNEESCYMYFKGGEVEADLGVFPHGTAEVNLRMPIEIFDGMMRGQVNGAKAAMTGKMSFTGNVRKAMSMQSILKLMMGAYTAAVTKVGDIDVSKLSAAPAEDSKGKEIKSEAIKEEVKKEGFFKRLFGKKEKTTTTVEKIVYAGAPTKPKTNDVRDEILQITDELYLKGMITSIGGNISARCEDNPNHVWITPSSIFKGDLRADMMVRIDLDGNVVGESELSASSEKMVHLAIYKRRPEVMAVVHSHAPKATLMALTGFKFKPISTDAAFVGDIPVVPFVIPGSPELGDMVGEAIGKEGSAVLMQNHGLVVCGNSPRRAADTTEVVELTAEKLLECHMLDIEPVLLPKEAQEELASIGKMLV